MINRSTAFLTFALALTLAGVFHLPPAKANGDNEKAGVSTIRVTPPAPVIVDAKRVTELSNAASASLNLWAKSLLCCFSSRPVGYPTTFD